MKKSIKILIEPKKERIPLPKKPPKVLDDEKAYKRSRNKEVLRKSVSDAGGSGKI